MTTQSEVKELTVARYEFFKTQANPMTDAQIMKSYNMDSNQFYAWKKKHDLIGKKYGLEAKPNVKTLKTVEVQEAPKEAKVQEAPKKEAEIPLLKENDTASVRALKAFEEYEANKKLKEKMDARKETPPLLQAAATVGDAFKRTGEEIAKSFNSVVQNEAESFTKVKDQLKQKMAELEKEKAWLEEQHVKDTAEKDALREQLEKAKQNSQYMELILKVSEDVKAERFRQNSLYGHQRHEHWKWLAILAEEFGEVAQAMQSGWGWGKESDASDLYKELTHVGAVANAFAEQVLEEQQSGGKEIKVTGKMYNNLQFSAQE